MIIDYFPTGTRNTPSSRLRVFKIADELSKLGHSVCINDYRLHDKDVVVIQKRLDCNTVMQQARERGIRVIFDVDDYIPNLPTNLADVTTVDTPAKLSLYPDAVVIPDALDIDDASPFKATHREKLDSVVWTGSRENIYHLKNAAAACEKLGLDLTIVTDLGKASWAYPYAVTGIQWTLDSVDAELVKHDLFIAPFMFQTGQWSDEWVKSKSPNRILKAWALGLPVIATPIPSYEALNFLSPLETVDEWVRALKDYNSQNIREWNSALGCHIAQEYRAEKVVEQWLTVFMK